MKRLAIALLAAASAATATEPPEPPWVDRLAPFGGARGETIEVTVTGERLPATPEVAFDSDAIEWVETISATPEALRGRVRIAADAPLGPRLISLAGPSGRSNTRLFYVDTLPSEREVEPNDLRADAQSIEVRPQVIHGALPELPDRDFYSFSAKAGERWTFDVRSIEYGGFLECDLTLLDPSGAEVAFNDDRDDYLETPFLEHRFEHDGDYLLKVDQYRGPQRVNCAANCGYMLRVSQGPVVEAIEPLGGRIDAGVEITVIGRGLGQVTAAYLSPLREGEYYRMTFPHTMPLRLPAAAASRIEAEIAERGDLELRLRATIPQTRARVSGGFGWSTPKAPST